MGILHRYVLKEFLPRVLLGLGIFTFFLVMNKLFELAGLLLSKGVRLSEFFSLFGLLMPNLLSLALPMATLWAGFLGLGRLSQDGEILALRASGISPVRILLPVLLASLIASVLLYQANHDWVPKSHIAFKKLYTDILFKNPILRLQPRTFFEIGDLRIYVKSAEGTRLSGVILLQWKPDSNLPRIITAPRGDLISTVEGPILQLERGEILWIDSKDSQKLLWGAFEMNRVNLKPPEQEPSQQSFLEETSRQLFARGLQNPGEKRSIRTEIALRSALAFAAFLFCWLAAPLAISLGRGAKLYGMGISMALIFAYYIAMGMVVVFAQAPRRGIPAEMIVWIPNILLILCGGFFWRRIR